MHRPRKRRITQRDARGRPKIESLVSEPNSKLKANYLMAKQASGSARPCITDRPLDAETLGLIKASAAEAAQWRRIDTATWSAEKIIAAIDETVYELQMTQSPPLPDEGDPAISLGSLWGEQLVGDFAWEWAAVHFGADGTKSIGVVSANRSLAIYPLYFARACLDGEAAVTIALAFNMLKDGKRIPKLPPRGYAEVMSCVRPIVPRG